MTTATVTTRRGHPATGGPPAQMKPAGKQPAKQPAATKVATKVAKATPQGKAASVAVKATGAGKPKKSGAALGNVGSHGRKWLLAEFVLCVLLLGLSGMTGGGRDDAQNTGSHMAIKGSALAGVFLVLGLVSAGGKGAEKAAGALGLVVTLAYIYNEGPTFKIISDWAKKQSADAADAKAKP